MARMQYQRFCICKGFTLLELLVSLLIIGVITSMLLPAVQSARESSRRLHCKVQLKELALACLSYESDNRYLPPSRTIPTLRQENIKRHNFIAFILPYIGEQSLADGYSLQFNWYERYKPSVDRSNYRFAQLKIDLLHCKSVPERNRQNTSDYSVCERIGKTGRKNSPIEIWTQSAEIYPRASWDSILSTRPDGKGFLRRTRIKDVSDGMSKSMMLFEDSARPGKIDVRESAVLNFSEVTSGALWADHNSVLDADVLCDNRAFNCTNDNEIFSFHPNGCNFAFGDGSVRFMENNMYPEVFVSLFTRDADDLPYSNK